MGYRLLQRMAADVADLGYIESNPKQDGRNMIMVIGPHKKKAEAKAEQRKHRPDEAAAGTGEAQVEVESPAPSETAQA
jgi:translation initiation factor IF-3